MKLILLGTGGYRPNDRRQTLCTVLPDYGVMLDAGTGLYRAGACLQGPDLDIFLTHAHLDHIVGLTYLLEVARAHPLRRVTVHGEADKLAAVDTHLFADALFPKRPALEFRPLGAGPVGLADGGRLSWFPLVHPGGSIGYRLDWPGHSMAYVTDTPADPAAEYVEKIHGVGLLIHECYFPDTQAEWARLTGHSHTRPVLEVARRAAVGRLLLVHLNPLALEDDPVGLEDARGLFPATALAVDGMAVDF
jgi:ribonuclease BN (tRNA processing enzyme)